MLLVDTTKKCLRYLFQFLTFRLPEVFCTGNNYRLCLCLGLICTWLAGIGRYWENERANIWQMMGMGSLVYVFVLASLLWIIIAPLRPARWGYNYVLLFVTLTAPPAFLYAIPVERYFSLETANNINVMFLAVVSVWRVELLIWFLRRFALMGWFAIIVAVLVPILVIVTGLTMLNLEHVIFDLMAGIRESDKSGNDGIYMTVMLITIWAWILAPVFLLAYIIMVINAWRIAKNTAIHK